jgi:spore coat polysaccharide biosynthesis protein SpsF
VITAVIVQARMGSSRLPGKVMKMLGGRTVLHHVLDRCRAIPGADVVVCAVPDEAASAPLEAVAVECRAEVFRGSESDVLDRYLGAARSVDANIVMRITSDCPLIDPQICGEVLVMRRQENADYAANNMPRSFPLGLDAEAFTMAALEEAGVKAAEPYDREHVTPWLRRAEHMKRVNLACGNAALARHRWTLDYPEDLAFFRAVFAALPAGSPGHMADVLAVLAAQPDIAAINQSRYQVGA